MIAQGETAEPRQEGGLQSFDDFDLKLGDIMRGERATLGKSLLDVQREIKIKASYLAAIEETDLGAFETPGFIAGYVKSYARYLGMDPEWVYRSFCAESGFTHVAGLDAQVYAHAAPVQKRPAQTVGVSDAILARSPIQTAAPNDVFAGIEAGAVGSLLVLVALIAGLGYGAWSVVQEIQRVTVAPVETDLAVLPAERAAGLPTATAGGPIAAEPTRHHAALERLYRPEALDQPVLVARDGPIATLDPREQGVYASYTPPAPVATEPPARQPTSLERAVTAAVSEAVLPEVQVVEPPAPKVVIFARNPAWVRVSAADGTVLLEKILEEGERFVMPETGAAPVLRAGNSGALYFAVNGKTIGPAGAPGTIVKDIELSADALLASYSSADLERDPELARIAALVMDPVPEPAPSNTP